VTLFFSFVFFSPFFSPVNNFADSPFFDVLDPVPLTGFFLAQITDPNHGDILFFSAPNRDMTEGSWNRCFPFFLPRSPIFFADFRGSMDCIVTPRFSHPPQSIF